MTTFVVSLELNADFFREMYEKGEMNKTELMRELKRHIKDEVNEYHFNSILDEMITFDASCLSSKRVVCEKG